MNLELTGTTAFVTGASGGIGAASARILAQEGADVVVGYGHDEKGARETAGSIEASGRRAWLSQMDLGNARSVRTAVEQIQAVVSYLDIVILCAGQNIVTPWQEITTEEWNHILDVNLGGAFHVLQAVHPLLRAGGSVVTVASVAAHTGAPHHLHYAAAKAGLVNLTKSLARAWAPQLRVNCVAPGLTLTPMGSETIATLDADYAEKKIPLGRYAEPEEIARCIVFVASPIAGFMTGTTIDINGGRDMR